MVDNNYPENNSNKAAPWVCFKGRDGDYDAYHYEIIGNSDGLKEFGERLIEISKRHPNNITTAIKVIQEYEIAIDHVSVADTSFEKFKEIVKDKSEKKSEYDLGDFGCLIIALFVAGLFISGVINGFKTLFL